MGGTGRQSLVQEQAPDAYRGGVFGALSSLASQATLAGFMVGGVLCDAIGLVALAEVEAEA